MQRMEHSQDMSLFDRAILKDVAFVGWVDLAQESVVRWSELHEASSCCSGFSVDMSLDAGKVFLLGYSFCQLLYTSMSLV